MGVIMDTKRQSSWKIMKGVSFILAFMCIVDLLARVGVWGDSQLGRRQQSMGSGVFNFRPVYTATVNGENWEKAYWGSSNHLSVDFGDVDSDGDLDLVQGSRYRLEWMRSWGGLSNFEWKVGQRGNIVQYDNRYWTPVFVDIDGDVDLDLFCGTLLGPLSFWENTGNFMNPVWTHRSDYYAGITPGMHSCPTFRDIDNDGDEDLFIGDADGTVHFYLNTGDSQSPLFVRQEGSYVETGVTNEVYPEFMDIDGDWDFDLFVGKHDGTISFYRNTGTPQVAAWTLESAEYVGIDAGLGARVRFANVDGDSDVDMFVTNDDGLFFFYQNDGTANSPVWNEMTSHYLNILDFGLHSAPTAGDFDRDGDFDLLIGTNDVYMLRNTGTPQEPAWEWLGSKVVDPGGNWHVPELVDIDGDGDLDLFVGSNDGDLYYYENIGVPATAPWNLVTTNYHGIDLGTNSHVSASFADINGDGDFDMFVQHHVPPDQLMYYANIGTMNDPSWVLMDDNYLNIGSYGIAFGTCDFGDLDRDGDLDILFGDGGGQFHYFENRGDASSPEWEYAGLLASQLPMYYEVVQLPVDERYSAPCLVDLNGDSDIDLVSGLYGGGLQFWWNTVLEGLHIVTNTEDSGPGSLRQAISDANSHAGPDTILFKIPTDDPGFDGTVWTITPLSSLPNIQDLGTVIDGTSQTMNQGDTNPFGPEIVLDGRTSTWHTGFVILSSDNAISGFVISGFESRGVVITGEESDHNWIWGNYFGTTASGADTLGNLTGILISGGANHNTIGGTDPSHRNVISGNLFEGIYLRSDSNVVIGNFIGTTADGVSELGNGTMGVRIRDGAQYNRIGPGNTIRFNEEYGVNVTGASTLYNTITENSISDNAFSGIGIWDGGNGELNPPVITDVGSVSGTVPPNATVEIFSDPENEGLTYEATVVADGSGNFTWSGTPAGPYVTATATDADGNTSEFSDAFSLTGVELTDTFVPEAFSLSQNFPNPFNPETMIRFDVKEPCCVVLKVYNLLGREVLTLVDESYEPGRYEATFDAAGFASGLYFYQIKMGDFQAVRKMVVME